VAKRFIEEYSSNQTDSYYNHEENYADNIGDGDAKPYTDRVDEVANMSIRSLYRRCEARSHRCGRVATRIEVTQTSL
jgi:hypothetical protein